MEETADRPKWLLELENRKRKPRLAHEAGAGASCMLCALACPGLDLHFWRKICKNCKCSRDDHDFEDDDFPQFDLLFGSSKKFKKKPILLHVSNEKHHEAESAFEWVPPDTTRELAADYMKALPKEKLPIKGSAGAALRRQLLQKQLPLHDIDYKACDELSDQEKKQFEKYLENIKKYVGQGKVTKMLSARPFDRSLMTPANATDMQRFSPQHKPSVPTVQLRTPSSFTPKTQYGKAFHDNSPRQYNLISTCNNSETARSEPIKSGAYNSHSNDSLIRDQSGTTRDTPSNTMVHSKSRNPAAASFANVDASPLNRAEFPRQMYKDTLRKPNTSIAHSEEATNEHVRLAESILADALLPPSTVNSGDIIGSTLDEKRLMFIREKLTDKYSAQENQMVPNTRNLARDLDSNDLLRKNVPLKSTNTPYSIENYTPESQLVPGVRNITHDSLRKNVPLKGANLQGIENYGQDGQMTPNAQNVTREVDNGDPLCKNVPLKGVNTPYSIENYAQESQLMPDARNVAHDLEYNDPPRKNAAVKSTSSPYGIENCAQETQIVPGVRNVARNLDYGDTLRKNVPVKGTNLQGIEKDVDRNAIIAAMKNPSGVLTDDKKPERDGDEYKSGTKAEQDVMKMPASQSITQSVPVSNPTFTCQTSDKGSPARTRNFIAPGNEGSSKLSETPFMGGRENSPMSRYKQNESLLPGSTLNDEHPSSLRSQFPSNCDNVQAKLSSTSTPCTNVIHSEGLHNQIFPHEAVGTQQMQNLPNVEHLKGAMEELLTIESTKQKCQKCEEEIRVGDVVVVTEKAKNATWHPGCFVCDVCNELLVDLVYFHYKNKLYCGRDLATLLGIPRCFACDELIFVREYTVAEGHNYHVKHFCCWDCDVPLAGQRYITENDRPLCLPCYQKTYAKTCNACNTVIAADQQGVSVKNLNFHANEGCFCCYACKKNLLNSKMAIKEDKLFCSKECIAKILRPQT